MAREQYFMTTLTTEQGDPEDEDLDTEVLAKLAHLGYPTEFVVDSVQSKELTDACTVYWLVLGMK